MSTPKYKIIHDQIVKFILTDVWPEGSNMKSENELIKLFGVSRLTIY
jgi:DNA-binding GntR family transcriptional regulator